MMNLVCLLEEPSAAEMLKGILPRLFGDSINIIPIVFEGKQDLEHMLEKKIRNWLLPDSLFLVMRDQDAGDCILIKTGLLKKVQRAGKKDKTLIRIACRELESFYFGDMNAVESALGVSGLSSLKRKSKYRYPDRIENPAEELIKITKGAYQKISGSRLISPLLDLERNTSHSFNVLISGIKQLVKTGGIKSLEE